jgi:hypothetical protein
VVTLRYSSYCFELKVENCDDQLQNSGFQTQDQDYSVLIIGQDKSEARIRIKEVQIRIEEVQVRLRIRSG